MHYIKYYTLLFLLPVLFGCQSTSESGVFNLWRARQEWRYYNRMLLSTQDSAYAHATRSLLYYQKLNSPRYDNIDIEKRVKLYCITGDFDGAIKYIDQTSERAFKKVPLPKNCYIKTIRLIKNSENSDSINIIGHQLLDDYAQLYSQSKNLKWLYEWYMLYLSLSPQRDSLYKEDLTNPILFLQKIQDGDTSIIMNWMRHSHQEHFNLAESEKKAILFKETDY